MSYLDLAHFHGDNMGSNPVGDANKTKDLDKIEPKPEGLKGFDKIMSLSGFIFVLLLFPHNLPCCAAVRFTSVTACVYPSIVTLKMAWRRSYWIVLMSSPLAFIRVPKLCRRVRQPTGAVMPMASNAGLRYTRQSELGQ
jgi:hypothetical protein